MKLNFFLIINGLSFLIYSHAGWLIEENTDANQDKSFITISLGSNCHPAWYTRKFNVRSFAFPFDWCLSPYKSVYGFLKNDFKNYFSAENLVPFSKRLAPEFLQKFIVEMDYSQTPKDNWVLDKKTGMVYNHDFSGNSFEAIRINYRLQYDKYLRRISRFYNEVQSGKKVYFIRYLNITKTRSLKLFNLIAEMFPDVQFTLIVIGNTSDFKQSWDLTHIKNYYVQHDESFWQQLCTDISSGKLLV